MINTSKISPPGVTRERLLLRESHLLVVSVRCMLLWRHRAKIFQYGNTRETQPRPHSKLSKLC
jgi:hypothetical protein